MVICHMWISYVIRIVFILTSAENIAIFGIHVQGDILADVDNW